ncbi:amino acid ABC transporter substrate-binding protein [Candidatus Bathyarchaeota archaeon]|nr:amino acid ABC transporter substrate-binding protein [Candidatus Bathyarchaeota archaeon]
MSEGKISRRKYLKYAGAAVAAGAAAAAGYGLSQYYKPPTPTGPTPTTPTGGARKKLRIGTTKPLTGQEAVLGRNELNGTLLWVKMVNEAGGIRAGDGNTYEVELIYYNDENKPENVGRLFEKLITEDKVDYLFGPIYGPLGMATVPVVTKYRKLEFYGTASYDPSIWREEYGDYVVHVCTNGSHYLRSMIDMIMDYIVPELDPDAKNVAIIHGDDIFRNVAGVGGYEYAKEKGVNLVLYEKYHTGVTDLSPILSKLKEANASILLAGAAYPDAVLITKQLKELDINLKLFFPGTGAVTWEWYRSFEKYAEYVLAITQWEPGVIYDVTYGPTHDEYVERYTKEYGQEPEYASAIGFTQGLALQMAMEKTKDPLNHEALRETIRKDVEFTGFYGLFKTDRNGLQVGHEVAVMQWQDGRKKCVWPPKVANAKLRYPAPKWSER